MTTVIQMIETCGPGGAENVMFWLANGLAGRGHEVHIISRQFDPGLWEDQRHPNLFWHELPTLEAMSKAGSALVQERFTLESFLARFKATAAELVESHRAGSALEPDPQP